LTTSTTRKRKKRAGKRRKASKAKSTKSKYGNKKVTLFGRTFDSKREANYYPVLRARLRAGEISDLRLQEKIFITIGGVEVRYERGNAHMYYIADFTFREDGRKVVIDVKGMKTDVYRLKRALLRAMGITIIEI
jgi:hypothetical protein